MLVRSLYFFVAQQCMCYSPSWFGLDGRNWLSANGCIISAVFADASVLPLLNDVSAHTANAMQQ